MDMPHAVSLVKKQVGKPDAANLHFRFDERNWESGQLFAAFAVGLTRLTHWLQLGILESVSKMSTSPITVLDPHFKSLT